MSKVGKILNRIPTGDINHHTARLHPQAPAKLKTAGCWVPGSKWLRKLNFRSIRAK